VPAQTERGAREPLGCTRPAVALAPALCVVDSPPSCWFLDFAPPCRETWTRPWSHEERGAEPFSLPSRRISSLPCLEVVGANETCREPCKAEPREAQGLSPGPSHCRSSSHSSACCYSRRPRTRLSTRALPGAQSRARGRGAAVAQWYASGAPGPLGPRWGYSVPQAARGRW